MKAKYCSVFRKGFSVYVGQKCINLFCYNFFTSDQYQGTRRLVCSEKCREMRIKQTGYLNGNFKKNKIN